MKKFIAAMGVVALLTACGTTVPLNDVPVADAAPKVVTAMPPVDASSTGVKGKGVESVVLGGNSTQGSTSSPLPAASKLVYFDYDSFVIKPEFQSVITANARLVTTQPGRKIAIEGHTDERGGREYNLALGQRRADAVRSALAILGVAQSQMESVSFGKEKPAVAGGDETAYAKNRRTEIRYQ